MARAIRIPFTADPRDFIRGLGLMEDDVDKFERKLRDSEDAGDQLEDNLEQNFRNIARDADTAGKKAGDGFDQGLTTNVRRGSFRGAAGALLAEAADEFIESWGEAIREGNPAGVIKEVFSNAALIGAAAGGPAGAAVGMAISLVATFISNVEQRRENVRATVSSLFDSVVGDAELTGQQMAQALYRGYVGVEDIAQNVAKALGMEVLPAAAKVDQMAQDTGLSYETVQTAILGDRDALRKVEEQTDAVLRASEDVRAEMGRVKDVSSDQFREQNRIYDVLGDQAATLNEIRGLGGEIGGGNRESARLNGTIQRAMQRQAEAASGVRDYINAVRMPDAGPLSRDMLNAASGAQRVRDNVNSIPRSVTVDVTYRPMGTGNLVP